MASWFTRALDRITPWDRGGEVQRRQEAEERRRREEEERQRRQAERQAFRPAPTTTPQVRQPQNAFQRGTIGGQEFDLTFRPPQNRVSVPQTDPATEAIDELGLKRPKQGFWNRVRDVFDTNTEADQYRRLRGNILKGEEKDIIERDRGNVISNAPVIGFGAKAVNTLGNQAREVVETGRGQVASMTGNQRALAESLRRQDQLRENYKRNSGLFGAGTLYDNEEARRGDLSTGVKRIGLPTAVTAADVFTLGRGAAIEQGIRQAGIRAGIRNQARNIGQASVGNYLSGDLDARSRDGSNAEAIQSGIMNTVFGLVPDIALPGIARRFQGRIIPRFLRGGDVTGEVIDELDDAAIAASAEAAAGALTPRPVRITQNIPINQVDTPEIRLPVRDITPQGEIIREVVGDAPNVTRVPTRDEAANQRSMRRFQEQQFTRPDERIEGVTPRQATDPDVVTKADIEAEKAVLDEMLEAKEITKKQHSAAVKELESTPTVDGPQPDGRPVPVRVEENIPVVDESVVPIDVPEAPGTVRATTQSDPLAVRTQAAAEQPVQIPPPPPRAGTLMPDGTRLTKRQVDSLRNQRKLAQRAAREQEKRMEALNQYDSSTASRRDLGGRTEAGFAQTDTFRRGKGGDTYEAANRQAGLELGAREIADRDIDNLISDVGNKRRLGPEDRDRIEAGIQRVMDSTPENYRNLPEYQTLSRELRRANRNAAQMLATAKRLTRKTATADELTTKWENKMGRVLDETNRTIPTEDIELVARTNEAYTAARSQARAAGEAYRANPSKANLEAVKRAIRAEESANIRATTVEAQVGKKVLRGVKSGDVDKLLKDLEAEADLNMMDYWTANQLSGPATGFRNLFGTEAAGVENRLFANTRARITNRLFGSEANAAGFDRASARAGRVEGWRKFVDDASRRQNYAGRNVKDHVRNIATTINAGGESSMKSQVESRLGAYYRNQLKANGVSGDQLARDVEFMRLTDPDNMRIEYQDAVMKASGLSGIYQKSKQIERTISQNIGDHLSGALGGVIPDKAAHSAARLLTRVAFGYPTATANFIAQSTKRLMLGLPSYIEAGALAAKGNKQAAAMAFDRAMKESGSGVAMLGFGAMLGAQGLISGPYPDDPDERARWEREGISENSIRIGNSWHPIPQGLGMLGLPILTGAAIGREGDGNDSLVEMYKPKNLAKLLPTDQLQGSLGLLSGSGTDNQVKNFVASTIRTGVPLGSLFNQVAKGLDPTKNDTTTKDFWSNVIDQVITGIPGQHLVTDIPTKLSDTGAEITNPGLLSTLTGASSAAQPDGELASQQIREGINSQLEQMDSFGALSDPNLQAVLEGTALEAFNKAQAGRQLDESDIKALQSGLVKGVSQEGNDTAYLERGQYDTHLAALKLKRQLMEQDSTVKPSSMEKMETAIKRGEIYRDNQVPYELIRQYKSGDGGVDVEAWRKMGIPPGHEDHDPDAYNPELYEQLWQLDQMMTEAGVGFGKNGKQKYYLKESKSGSGSGRRRMNTDTGSLPTMTNAPRVQEYQAMPTSRQAMPVIRIQRPNIVHRIGTLR